jgi:hypothetical protein
MRLGLGNTLVNNGLSNPDLLSLDLNFAVDKTLTARRGPKPAFTRTQTNDPSTGSTYVGSDGLIKYAASNTPRFDHNPVSPFACKGLLIEEQRTNSAQKSAQLDDAYWFKNQATVSADAITSPDGTTTADKIIPSAVSTDHTVGRNSSGAAGAYTVSAFFKAGEINTVMLYTFISDFVGSIVVRLDTLAATLTGSGSPSYTLTAYANGWYRLTLTATHTAAFQFGIRVGNDGNAATYSGDSVKGIYAWGAQVEAGAFATSYIPTTTSPSVRSADVCSITGSAFTGIYNQPEGTFLSSSSQPVITSVNALVYAADNNSDTERFNLRHQNSIALSQVVGVFQTTFGGMGLPTANSISKMAYAYKATNYAAARNSTLGSSESNGTVPTIDRIYIGSKGHNSTEYLNGHIQFLRLYKKRLPDAKLQSLTT